MKKLSLCLLTLALVGCGKNELDKNALPVKKAPPIKKASLKAVAQEPGVKCPLFDGMYFSPPQKQKDGSIEPTVLELKSEEENGQYSYSLAKGMSLIVADGQPKRVDDAGLHGEVRLSCDAESVELVRQEDGKEPSSLKITVVDTNQVEVESTSDASLNGLFDLK